MYNIKNTTKIFFFFKNTSDITWIEKNNVTQTNKKMKKKERKELKACTSFSVWDGHKRVGEGKSG